MIKYMMVWLDGGISDENRLAAVADIARWLDAQVVIGLFLNVLPLPGRIEGDATAEVIDHAREAGDLTEALLARRLQPWGKACRICTRRRRSRSWLRPASAQPRKRRFSVSMRSTTSSIMES